MSWNHRILAHQDDKEFWFEIHEVYYNEDRKPEGYTADGMTVSADTPEGIEWMLKEMQKARQKPILWAGDRFPEIYATPDGFKPPFRVGRKQARAVLDAVGTEVVVFPEGRQRMAIEFCDFLNQKEQL